MDKKNKNKEKIKGKEKTKDKKNKKKEKTKEKKNNNKEKIKDKKNITEEIFFKISYYDKNIIKTITTIVCINLLLVLYYNNLNHFDSILSYISIIMGIILIYSVHNDNRFFINLVHYFIIIFFFPLSIFFTNEFLLFAGLICVLFVQIQWKCLNKCILWTDKQEKIVEYYGLDYIFYFGVLFITIIISYKLGKLNKIKL